MERGHREKQEMIQRLEQVRNALRREAMAPALRAEFEYALSGLERDVLKGGPADTAAVVAALSGWVPRLQPGHPALAVALDRVLREWRDPGA